MEETNLTACIICNKTFKDPRSYEPHLKIHKRNHECEDKVDAELSKLHSNSGSKKKYSCDQCHSKFSTPYSLKYHQSNTCKENLTTIVVEKAKDMLNRTDDMAMLKEFSELVNGRLCALQQNNVQNNVQNNIQHVGTGQGVTISSTSGDVNVKNSVIVNQTSNNTYNIILNPHGSEKVEDLPEVLASLKDSFRKLHKNEDLGELENISMEVFKHIYCNEKKPENQNIYVTNGRPETKFYVYKDKETGWERSGDLNLLMQDYERINNLIKENLATVTKNQQYLEEMRNVMDGLNQHYDQNRPPNKSLSRHMGKNYHNTLYNNKDTVEKTFKQTTE